MLLDSIFTYKYSSALNWKANANSHGWVEERQKNKLKS